MRYWFLLQAHEPRSDRARLMLMVWLDVTDSEAGSIRHKMSQLRMCCEIELEEERRDWQVVVQKAWKWCVESADAQILFSGLILLRR